MAFVSSTKHPNRMSDSKGINTVKSSETIIMETNINHQFANHSEMVVKSLHEQYKNKKFCDVILDLGHEKISAHRSVLAGCSSRLKTIFESEDSPQSTILFQGLDSEVFSSLISYCYTGKISLSSNKISVLKSMAQFLEMKDIESFCDSFLKSNVETVNNTKETSVLLTQVNQDVNPRILTASTADREMSKLMAQPIKRRKVYFLNRFECDQCEFSCSRKSDLRIHIRAHSLTGHEKQYKCLQCGYITHRPQDMISHRRVHSGERPFQCQDCNYSFSRISNLRRHRRKAHCIVDGNTRSACELLRCGLCGFESIYQSVMDRHHLSHMEKKFECAECHRSFTLEKQLMDHIRTHGDLPFKCNKCLYATMTAVNLKKHIIRKHTKPIKDQFSCQICQKKFSDCSNLKRHLLSHMNIRPYKCDQCQFAAVDVTKLCSHRKSQHPTSNKKSATVTVVSSANSSLIAENFVSNTKIACFVDKCGYLCDNMDGLSEHLLKIHDMAIVEDDQSVHSGNVVTLDTNDILAQSNYLCNGCQLQFASDAMFREHLKVCPLKEPQENATIIPFSSQTSVETNKCTICNQSFLSGDLLQSHFKSCHPDVIIVDSVDREVLPTTSSNEIVSSNSVMLAKPGTSIDTINVSLSTTILCNTTSEIDNSSTICQTGGTFFDTSPRLNSNSNHFSSTNINSSVSDPYIYVVDAPLVDNYTTSGLLSPVS